MTQTLQSFIGGRWIGTEAAPAAAQRRQRPAGRQHPCRGRSTSARRCQHARKVGLPACWRWTSSSAPQRLKALAKYLAEHKEELYAISAHTGATRADSWIDIEGGTGTLFAYAGIGSNELPSGNLRARRPGHAARQEGRLRRHPHPGAARRRRGAHQRLQLPGLGPAREVRAELPRRHALHRQAGHRDQLPHRGAGAR